MGNIFIGHNGCKSTMIITIANIFLHDFCVLGTLYEFSFLIFKRTLRGRYCYCNRFTKKTETRDGTLILLNFKCKVMHLHLKNRLRSVSGHVVNWMCRETFIWYRTLKMLAAGNNFIAPTWLSWERSKETEARKKDRQRFHKFKIWHLFQGVGWISAILCDLEYGF